MADINIKPMVQHFDNLSSTPIIQRLYKLWRATTAEEKQAVYNEAIRYLESQGEKTKEKWQKTFKKGVDRSYSLCYNKYNEREKG